MAGFIWYTDHSVLQKYLHLYINTGLNQKECALYILFIDKEPNMVLIEAVKDGNPMIKIEPPLIVYDLPGKYTKRILKIYGPYI